jgi:hypothetical protein
VFSSGDLLDDGTMLIFHEGVKLKCVRVRVVNILVPLVEPVLDIKVGFRLRLVLRGEVSVGGPRANGTLG